MNFSNSVWQMMVSILIGSEIYDIDVESCDYVEQLLRDQGHVISS